MIDFSPWKRLNVISFNFLHDSIKKPSFFSWICDIYFSVIISNNVQIIDFTRIDTERRSLHRIIDEDYYVQE